MAILHEATITPTKDQLVQPWLRTQDWWDGVEERNPVGTFRLDDPAGEVGIECFLFGSGEGGSVLFVPLTYRAGPLADAEDHLLGTMEHSVLGTRWVYDASADPVFASTLMSVIASGGRQADLEVHRADGTVGTREPTVQVRGSGSPDLPVPDPAGVLSTEDGTGCTTIRLGELTLTIARQIGSDLPEGPTLTASFAGGTNLTVATVS